MEKYKLLRWMVAILCLLIAFGAAGSIWLVWDFPHLDELKAHLNVPSVRIVDRNGQLLYEILPEQGGRHAIVSLNQIPKELWQATIATEDRGFYTHPGVDIKGILRAAWINLRGGRALVGGSTITQQVARNLWLGAEERGERSLRRKLREMLIAWQLTRRLSKDGVLLLYLNQTYYGGMAYGVEAASQTYFAKPASELDLAECALLAGLPQAPALYNPFTDFAAAKKRQEVVLRLMEEDGYITPDQRELANREVLVLAEKPFPIEAPHFVMMVRNRLDQMFSQEEIFSHGGLIVRTTLDLNWQKQAESAVSRHLRAMQQSEDGLGHNMNNAALVAMDPDSGEIFALVGSPDYFDPVHAGAINMALSPRQPGSALKPLVYAVALDPSHRNPPWTAASMLLDVRTSFLTHEGKAYIPENYDLREHGPILLRQALASSLNIPAVITLEHIGLDALFEMAQRLGITTLKDPHIYDLSLALGGGEIRLLELTAAYGAFANSGFRVDSQIILEVTDPRGGNLHSATEIPRVRVLDPRVAWLVSDILSDNDARRMGFGPNSVLRLDRTAAVKTGTTSNFHDNWTIGYTPDLVVGVWSGNTNYEPMRGVNGLSGAAPIWHQFMRSVLKEQADKSFDQPPGFTRVEICSLSGLLPTEECPYRRYEWFIQGTQPTRLDPFYKKVILDARSGSLADRSTPPALQITRIVLDLPPQAQPWARSQNLLLFDEIQNNLPAEITEVNQKMPIDLISPANGSVYILTQGAPSEVQRILLEAVAEKELNHLTFYMDGQELARFIQGPFRVWWVLDPGEHHVWVEAVTQDGKLVKSAVITFVVKD